MRKLNYEFENHNGLQLIITSNPIIEYNQLNQFELNMLKQNQLQHFLYCETVVIDNEYKFHYHVHNYKKLQHYMQVHCTTQIELYQFTSKLIDAINSSYTNMLTPDGCIIHADTLFFDEKTNQIYLTYLPMQYKDKMLFSLLQWFLYWSDHVQILDATHLHRIFSCFIEQEFTLEKIQEQLLEYLYQTHTGQAYPDDLEKVGIALPANDALKQPSVTSAHAIQTSHEIMAINEPNTSTNVRPSSKQQIHSSDSTEETEQIDDFIALPKHKPNLLRLSLIIIILACLPLGLWLKLYLPNPTMSHLLLSIGMSLFTLAIIVFITSKQLNKAKREHIAIDESFFSEDTGERHTPYHFSKMNSYKEEQIEEHRDLVTDMPFSHNKSSYNKQNEKAKTNGQLETVQLGFDNATVQLGQARQQSVYLIRAYLQQEQQFELNETDIVVGRSMDGVHINDQYAGVSRLHIQFEYKSGLVIAKDLGSRNGSYLNGKQITPYKNYMINEQDKIQLVDTNGPIYSVKWT